MQFFGRPPGSRRSWQPCRMHVSGTAFAVQGHRTQFRYWPAGAFPSAPLTKSSATLSLMDTSSPTITSALSRSAPSAPTPCTSAVLPPSPLPMATSSTSSQPIHHVPNDTTTETTKNETVAITTDIIEKIAKIEGVLAQLVPVVAQLVPAFAVVVDAFKQNFVDADAKTENIKCDIKHLTDFGFIQNDKISQLECANIQLNEKIEKMRHVHTRLHEKMPAVAEQFKKLDYLHEHLPKQLPMIVKKVHDVFERKVNEVLAELHARILVLEDFEDGESSEDEET